MSTPSVRVIRIDGIVPQSKAAIAEALKFAPKNIMLIDADRQTSRATLSNEEHVHKLLEEFAPGEEVAFTDGAGKYYGKIKRSNTFDKQFIFSME